MSIQIPTVSERKFDKSTVFVVCIFAYGGDARALGQCIRSLLTTQQEWTGLRIAVFDDGLNPLPYPPQSVLYTKTYFNRMGNLNGIETVQGELFAAREAARIFNAEICVKLDCDTIVRDWEWMMSAFNDSSEIGQVGIQLTDDMDWASGMCNASRVDAIRDALYVTSSAGLGASVPEDVGVTICIQKAGYQVHLIRQNKDNIPGWLGICTGYEYQNPKNLWIGWQSCYGYPIVTFGNRNILKDKEKCREICGEQMENFLDFLSGAPCGLKPGAIPYEALSLEEVMLNQDRGKSEDYLISNN